MTEHAKESGHWYRRDGSPAYTIIGKNGKERPTTLRDARAEKLVPSVTTIIKQAAAPGLTNWIIEQHLLAALTTPIIAGESEADYIARIKRDAGEQAKKARERGTLIHAWIQGMFEGWQPPHEEMRYWYSVKETLNKECGKQEWQCEKSFATERYGGKVDLICGGYIIDIKTTDKPVADLKTWDEHAMQLAAYDNGIGNGDDIRKCGILYVNSIDASSRLIWVSEEDMVKGWYCFDALLDYWYSKTGL